MPLSTAVTSILEWLHAGYPEGVPQQDYIPLVALLRRRLSDDDVNEIARNLATSDDGESSAALHAAIMEITREPPRNEDVARVRAQLARGGWPLAGLDD